jgi:hypothetical protein
LAVQVWWEWLTVAFFDTLLHVVALASYGIDRSAISPEAVSGMALRVGAWASVFRWRSPLLLSHLSETHDRIIFRPADLLPLPASFLSGSDIYL